MEWCKCCGRCSAAGLGLGGWELGVGLSSADHAQHCRYCRQCCNGSAPDSPGLSGAEPLQHCRQYRQCCAWSAEDSPTPSSQPPSPKPAAEHRPQHLHHSISSPRFYTPSFFVMFPALIALLAQAPSPHLREQAIELQPCRIAGVPVAIRCGTFMVYEDRAHKRGRRIPLFVRVIPSSSASPAADPFVLVSTG